jgi:hypothetical protein
MGKASRKKQERWMARLDTDINGNMKIASGREAIEIRKKYGGQKISDALGKLVKPYWESGMPLSAMQMLVSFGAVAWNMSIVPELEQAAEFDRMMTQIGQGQEAEGITIVKALITEMIERKRMLFPEDDRVIVNFKVIEEGHHDFFITAAATAPETGATSVKAVTAQ